MHDLSVLGICFRVFCGSFPLARELVQIADPFDDRARVRAQVHIVELFFVIDVKMRGDRGREGLDILRFFGNSSGSPKQVPL